MQEFKQIKNIIFDLGNVLIFHPNLNTSKTLSQILNVAEIEVSQAWPAISAKLATGKISTHEAITKLVNDLNLKNMLAPKQSGSIQFYLKITSSYLLI